MNKSRLIIFFLYLFSSITLFLISGCGSGDSESAKVKYTVNPDQPIIINTNFSLKKEDGDGDPETFEIREFTAPWFLFSFAVDNGSSQTITIVNLKLTITGVKDGVQVVEERTLDLSDLGDNITYVDEIESGSTSSTDKSSIQWVIDGLPNITGFSYTVKADVQGWIGAHDEPKERLTGTFSFTTQ